MKWVWDVTDLGQLQSLREEWVVDIVYGDLSPNVDFAGHQVFDLKQEC